MMNLTPLGLFFDPSLDGSMPTATASRSMSLFTYKLITLNFLASMVNKCIDFLEFRPTCLFDDHMCMESLNNDDTSGAE